MKAEISNVLLWYINDCHEFLEFKHRTSIDSQLKAVKLYQELREVIPDVQDLSVEELVELKFMEYQVSEDLTVYLIPSYLLPIVPEGTTLYSEIGNTVEYMIGGIDKTPFMFGCIRYGIKLKK